MAVPITTTTSTAPLLHPTTRPWFLLRNASAIIDWHSEHWTEYSMHILKEVVMIAQHRQLWYCYRISWIIPLPSHDRMHAYFCV